MLDVFRIWARGEGLGILCDEFNAIKNWRRRFCRITMSMRCSDRVIGNYELMYPVAKRYENSVAGLWWYKQGERLSFLCSKVHDALAQVRARLDS